MSLVSAPPSAASRLTRRTGGQVLIDQLMIHDVDHIFGVPGESYLAALDAPRPTSFPWRRRSAMPI